MKKLLFLVPAILAGLTAVASAQSQMPIPAYSSTYSTSAGVRGFFFKAPCPFIMTALQVPDEKLSGLQNVAVMNIGPSATQPAGVVITAKHQQLLKTGVNSASKISCNILFAKDDWVFILGCGGNAATQHSSYGTGPHTSSVLGLPVTINRLWMNSNIVSTGVVGNTVTTASGSIGRVKVWVTPPTGLYAGFDATPKVGASPFKVQFTDQTFSSATGGVKTWAWDFNGDSKVDATTQNPIFIYPTAGKTAQYSVTLTVTDGAHPASTATKANFITVDPKPVANFTATPTVGPGPLMVQFTDTSVGAGTWAWDFNNDSKVDSTIQNPKFVYAPGLYDVKLTVSNAGGSDSLLQTGFILALQPGSMLQTLPQGLLKTNGSSNNIYPWACPASYYPFQHQICYDDTEIKSTTPVAIKRIQFRPDCSFGTSTWTGGTFSNVTVKMSTCANAWNTLSRTSFAANHGADMKTVFNGTVTVKPGAQVTPGPYPGWYITITLPVPFIYDPAKGDLLFDFYLPNALVGGTSFRMDREAQATTKAYRLYKSATATSIGGGSGGLVTEVFWEKPKGLYASFDATPKTGSSPLKVQFSDTSYSSASGGVTSWAWDFNGDTVIDSTIKNPIYTYNTATPPATAKYDVSLTVKDGTSPAQTIKNTQFIVVDPPPTADFTATPTMGKVGPGLPPMIVSFTDASVGANTWAWDLDGDNKVDSTLQNPKFPYIQPGQYSVKLDVTGVGGKASITRTNFITVVGATANTASAEILEYQFNEVRTNKVYNTASTTLTPATGTAKLANWQGDAGRPGFMGNAKGTGCLALNSLGTNIIDTGWKPDIAGSFTIMWWMRHGTATTGGSAYPFGDGVFYGRVGGAATGRYFQMYARAGTAQVYLMSSVHTPPTGKWMHVAVVANDTTGKMQWFFDGKADTATTSFTPGTLKYKSTTTNNFAVGNYSPTYSASYAGTKYYGMDDFRFYGNALTATQILAEMGQENPATSPFDLGSSGPSTVPTIMGNMAPAPGAAAFAVNLAKMEASRPGLLMIATKATGSAFGVLALPFNLDFLLPGTGNNLHIDPFLFFGFVADATGNATMALPIPATGVEGAHIYVQGMIAGSTAGAMTPGLDINIEK